MRAAVTTLMLVLSACAVPAKPASTTPAGSMAPATSVGSTAPAPPPTPATTTAATSPEAPAITTDPTDSAAPSAPDPADPLQAFIRQWPRIEAELVKRQAAKLVWEGAPCAPLAPYPPATGRDAEPSINADTPASVSPDGRTLVVVATVVFDHTGAIALGLVHGDPQDEGMTTLAIVFDGPSGAFWTHPLHAFMNCNFNPHGFTWSADSHRVYVGVDTGHGERVALLDVAAHVLRFEGFTGLELASPGVEHVAWMPWFSGYPFADNKPEEVNGDELKLDDHKVWGSSDKTGARVWGVTWQSDTTLTFCGRTPKLRATQFRAVLAGKTVKVVRIGTDCPADGDRWVE